MRHLICIIFLLMCSAHSFAQQKKWILNKNSVVKDSSGNQYTYEEWSPLVIKKEYIAVPVDPKDENTSFILKPVTDEMRERWAKNIPKPKESPFFKTGEKFQPFKARAIDGEKISSKDLKGKILVINYWFIGCPPCRAEIPELNDLVLHFAKDTNVVFISIANDSNRDLKDFLKEISFFYKIIGYKAGGHHVTAFPTNVVVDKEGNVAFHHSGYSSVSVDWIKKAIEQLQKKE